MASSATDMEANMKSLYVDVDMTIDDIHIFIITTYMHDTLVPLVRINNHMDMKHVNYNLQNMLRNKLDTKSIVIKASNGLCAASFPLPRITKCRIHNSRIGDIREATIMEALESKLNDADISWNQGKCMAKLHIRVKYIKDTNTDNIHVYDYTLLDLTPLQDSIVLNRYVYRNRSEKQ